MRVIDNRPHDTEWFKYLEIGQPFEYLGSCFIKTGITASEPNAVDLHTGSVDIIRLDADVKAVNATIIISDDKGDNDD